MNDRNSYSVEIESSSHTNNGKIRVLLVDSDLDWQQRLVVLIETEPDINLLHIVLTEEEAIRASIQLDVDVIVMDLALSSSNRDGIDVMAEIYRKRAVPIIVCSSQNSPEFMIEAIVAGAVNYITKTNYSDLPDAIREAHYRRSALHADIAAIIREEMGRIKRKELNWMLTPTEKEILQLVGLGYRQTIIRELLGIAPNTMKSHVRHITGKFGSRSVLEAAEKAKRRGLYDLH